MDTSKEMHDAIESGNPEEIASAHVGVGTPPGGPPSRGTGGRTHANTSPPTGRVDAERGTWGRDDYVAGDFPSGEPVDNVGAPEGDLPTEAPSEFPGQEPLQDPGIIDRERDAGRL